MATISNVRAAVDQELQAVHEPGWRRGFANLLGNENRMWWGTRKWLVHLLLWLVMLNGLILLIGLTDGPDPNNPLKLYETLVQVLFQVGTLATAIGVVTTAQGAIVREKQLGTAAWVLSKPVSRSAFVLAKFVAYALAFVSLAIAAAERDLLRRKPGAGRPGAGAGRLPIRRGDHDRPHAVLSGAGVAARHGVQHARPDQRGCDGRAVCRVPAAQSVAAGRPAGAALDVEEQRGRAGAGHPDCRRNGSSR